MKAPEGTSVKAAASSSGPDQSVIAAELLTHLMVVVGETGAEAVLGFAVTLPSGSTCTEEVSTSVSDLPDSTCMPRRGSSWLRVAAGSGVAVGEATLTTGA